MRYDVLILIWFNFITAQQWEASAVTLDMVQHVHCLALRRHDKSVEAGTSRICSPWSLLSTYQSRLGTFMVVSSYVGAFQ